MPAASYYPRFGRTRKTFQPRCMLNGQEKSAPSTESKRAPESEKGSLLI